MWRNCLAYLAWHRQKNWTLGTCLRINIYHAVHIYIYSIYIYTWIIIVIIMIIVVYIIYTYVSASFLQHGKYLQFWSDLDQNMESRHLFRFLEHPKENMLRWFFPSLNHCEEDLSVYVYIISQENLRVLTKIINTWTISVLKQQIQNTPNFSEKPIIHKKWTYPIIFYWLVNGYPYKPD